MNEPADDIFAGIPRESDVFELVKALEFDHPTAGSGGDPVSVRIRLFRSVTDAHLFRCRLSRLESWRLQPTLDGPDAESDEDLDSGWDHMLKGNYDSYRADGQQQALAMVVDDLRSLLGGDRPHAS